jgi:hypothetical protein
MRSRSREKCGREMSTAFRKYACVRKRLSIEMRRYEDAAATGLLVVAEPVLVLPT